MKNVLFYPNDSGKNQYISINKDIVSSIGNLNVITKSELRNFKFIFNRRSNVLVLNWFENRLFRKGRLSFLGCMSSFAIFLMFKVYFSKIVFVKHNYLPHDAKDSKINRLALDLFFFLMRRFSSVQCAHLPIEGYSFIPHPLYPFSDHACNTSEFVLSDVQDFKFVIFGGVARYKGIEKLLNQWPKGETLYMLGKSQSDDLTEEILRVKESRGINIIWLNEFISDEIIDYVFSRAKYIILPHLDSRMIVSGAFYHAITYGVNVICHKSKFSEYLKGKYSFVHEYENETIYDTILKMESLYIPRNEVVSQAKEEHGVEAVREVWEKILN